MISFFVSRQKTHRIYKGKKRFRDRLASTLDPFVKVVYEPTQEEQITPVHNNGGTEVDFEGFEFSFSTDGLPVTAGHVLRVEVWDDDSPCQSDDLVGRGTVSLEELQKDPTQPIFKLLDLTDEAGLEYCGRIEVCVDFVPQDGKSATLGKATPPGELRVTVFKASNLRDTDVDAQFISAPRAIVILLLFFFFGALVMSLQEGYNVLDSVYFCVVTLTTVGYGDVLAKTQGGRLFVAFFVLTGIGLIATAISVFTSWVVAKKEKIAEELAQKKAAKQEALIKQRRERIEAHKEHKDEPLEPLPTSPSFLGVQAPDNRVPCEKFMDALWNPTAQAVWFFLFNLFLGALVFSLSEKQTFLIGFYYACVTLTTTGFGDFYFTTTGGKVFAIFWILIGTVSMARMLSQVIDARSAAIAELHAEKRNRRLLMKRTDFTTLDKDGSGKVSRLEFLVYKLVALGRCEQWQIDDVLTQFEALDEDGSGELEMKDFTAAQTRQIQAFKERVMKHRQDPLR